jgi:hypothetical protein
MLAPNNASKCKAFTKDHRACRLSIVNNNTCDIHKNYFVDWLYKNPALSEYTMNSRYKRLYKEYAAILFSGLVKVDKEYIISIPNKKTYSEFYLKLCSKQNIDPLSNKNCFKNAIELAIEDLFKLYKNSDINEWCIVAFRMYRTFNILFKDVEATKLGLYYVVINTISNAINLQNTYNIDEDLNIRLANHFFKLIYKSKTWDVLFMSSDILHILKDASDTLLLNYNPIHIEFYMNNIIYPSIEENKMKMSVNLKKRCAFIY